MAGVSENVSKVPISEEQTGEVASMSTESVEEGVVTYKKVDHRQKAFRKKAKAYEDLEEEYMCPYCVFQTDTAVRLQQHMSVKHKLDISISSESEDEQSEPVKEEEYMSCTFEGCAFKSRKQSGLNLHYSKMHHPNNCKKSTKRKPEKELSRSNNSESKRPATNGTAEASGSGLNRELLLAQYIGENSTCIKCKVSFKHRQGLLRHIQTLHLDSTKNHYCVSCDRNFDGREDLAEHNRIIHETQKQFQCPECLKWYMTSSSLDTHVETVHLQLKKHVCPVCKDEFSQPSSLQRHRRAKIH